MSDSRIRLSWENRRLYHYEQIEPVVLKPVGRMSLNAQDTLNMLIEGDNLNVMQALLYGGHRLRGSCDLVVCDPPYNTGKDFRYGDNYMISTAEAKRLRKNTKRDTEGELVAVTDPSRHTKWLEFMEIRLRKMREFLKQTGVMAVFIDDRELFRLGMLLDELFGEDNRLGVITWERSYSPKNDAKHISCVTDYILLYGKSSEVKRLRLLEDSSERKNYKNPDNDPDGLWRVQPLHATTYNEDSWYSIQHPVTGKAIFPPEGRSWRHKKINLKRWLEEYGSEYRIDNEGNLVAERLNKKKAEMIAKSHPYRKLYLGTKGTSKPNLKTYLKDIQKGDVPLSLWRYTKFGTTDHAIKMLNGIVGTSHKFFTVKPVQVVRALIRLYCPNDGIVLDPFAGSGTTGHAVLETNHEENSNISFVMIESGEPNDRFCSTLTRDRMQRVATGKWDNADHEPLGGGFGFFRTSGKITKATINAAERAQLADMILQAVPSNPFAALEHPDPDYLIGKTDKNRGIALVWGRSKTLTENTLYKILEESKREKLELPVLIFAKSNRAFFDDCYEFLQVPRNILVALGVDNS